jgi:hypothetical protein
MGPTDTIPPEAQALAEAQAEKDREFLADLRKKQVSEVILDETSTAENVAAAIRQPMNRAERRAQVKQYATILAYGNRQRPVINPTIIPKADRRLRKRSKHAH